MRKVRVFAYLTELDAFMVTREYRDVATLLGLAEWNPVVWIGRLFCMDNDFGEHWFDNWDLRAQRADSCATLGIDESELLIVDPDRFSDGRDGPCHDIGQRKRFWTDVLRSLELSFDLLFEEARLMNKTAKSEVVITDLEDRILALASTQGRSEQASGGQPATRSHGNDPHDYNP